MALIVFFINAGPNLDLKIPHTDTSFKHYLGSSNPSNFLFKLQSQSDVLYFISKLKGKTSYGFDLISNKVLKLIAPHIISPLTHILNLSLQNGTVASPFKITKVVPVFKGENKHFFTNYRPISLLSSFSKLLEKIVAKQLIDFLNFHNIFYKHQYGFRKHHCTSHPLIHFTHNIFQALNQDDPQFSLAIFIDLKKAFDTVNFSILLKKLSHYGIRNSALNWFTSYLSNRQQFTEVNGHLSAELTIKMGVPQGSVLGPLLFLLFINDLHNSSDFSSLLFADDTTLQLSGTNLNLLVSAANINLKKCEKWFMANRLTLNALKTKFVLFSPKNAHIHPVKLLFDGIEIEQIGDSFKTKSFKFLGHLIDDKLSWQHHLTLVKNKISSSIFALSHTKNILPYFARKCVYNSLISSHLTFGSMVFGATKYSKIKNLYALQKKAIRLVSLSNRFAHSDPLFLANNVLNLPDLIKYDKLCFMHKLRYLYLPKSFNNILHLKSEIGESRVRSDVGNFLIPPNKTGILFPLLEAAKDWNALPYHLKSIAKISTFKSEVKGFLLNNYSTECTVTDCFTCT